MRKVFILAAFVQEYYENVVIQELMAERILYVERQLSNECLLVLLLSCRFKFFVERNVSNEVLANWK